MSRSPSCSSALTATWALLPQVEKQGHEEVPMFATLSLEYVHVLAHLVPTNISMDWKRTGSTCLRGQPFWLKPFLLELLFAQAGEEVYSVW